MKRLRDPRVLRILVLSSRQKEKGSGDKKKKREDTRCVFNLPRETLKKVDTTGDVILSIWPVCRRF